MNNVIKLSAVVISLIFISSCEEMKRDKRHSFLNSCEGFADSIKYSKIEFGKAINLDILNGIKCFEFNSSIKEYIKLGNYIKHKNYEEIIFDDKYCFNYKNICWTTVNLEFLDGKLAAINLISNSETIENTSKLYNQFTLLLGLPLFNIFLKNEINNDTIYCFIDNYKYINDGNYNLIQNHEKEKDSIINEIQYGNRIGITNNEEVILIACNNKFLEESDYRLKFSYKPIIYNYNSSYIVKWYSKSILEINFKRDNPFRKDLMRSVNIDANLNKSTFYETEKVKYYPEYSINLIYYKDNISKNIIDSLKRIEHFNTIKSTNDSLVNDLKKSF